MSIDFTDDLTEGNIKAYVNSIKYLKKIKERVEKQRKVEAYKPGMSRSGKVFII